MIKANLLKGRDAKLSGLKLRILALQAQVFWQFICCHTCEHRMIGHGGWVARVRMIQALYFGLVFFVQNDLVI